MQTKKLFKLVLVTTALSSVMLASAATISSAADVPRRAYVYREPPPPLPYYLWTGFYVGAHVGGGWFDASDGFGDSISASGFVGGGQVGYNYQIGNWVWGAEFDASGSAVSTNLYGASFNVDSVETLTAKGGYAFDRWLVYGKFGGGWANVSVSVPYYSVGGTGTAAVFGVGTEYALTPNWSAKVEYNVLDFGSSDFGGTTTFQTIKAGVNYKFNGWPF